MTTTEQAAVLQGLPQGWFHHGAAILDLIEQHRPVTCVELGTWRGASAIAMARVLRQWHGVLYCVDTWMGDVNGGTIPGTPSMLTECAGNIIRAGVASSIRLIPALTRDAAKWWVGPIDFLYVDADHSYGSVLDDLASWVPHVKEGGLIVGDDYANKLYPGVKRAWDEFEQLSKIAFERVDTGTTEPAGMKLIYGVKVRRP